jgi:hypothetical protein
MIWPAVVFKEKNTRTFHHKKRTAQLYLCMCSEASLIRTPLIQTPLIRMLYPRDDFSGKQNILTSITWDSTILMLHYLYSFHGNRCPDEEESIVHVQSMDKSIRHFQNGVALFTFTTED